MDFKQGVSIAAVVVAAYGPAAVQAQTANTTPANVNVLNLLAPFLSLNGTAVGQQTLQLNLSRAIADNRGAPAAHQGRALSDQTRPGCGARTMPVSGQRRTG